MAEIVAPRLPTAQPRRRAYRVPVVGPDGRIYESQTAAAHAFNRLPSTININARLNRSGFRLATPEETARAAASDPDDRPAV